MRRFLIVLILASVPNFLQGQGATPQPYKLLEDKYAECGVASSFKPGDDWFPLPAYRDRAGWEALLDAGVRDSLVTAGEKYLDYKWQHIPASTYLAMNITGDKQAMRVIEMDNRTALISLMMAELAEGEGRFMMALADALWFYGTSYHWSHSNQTHHVLPAYEHERVALGNVRLGATIPIVWHFFHEEIDKLDKDICLAVEASVKRIILDPYLDDSLDEANWWLGTTGRKVNNWCPWCNHGVLVAFLLMEKDPSRLDRAVAKSVKSVDCWLRSISLDGCCDEGPTYWSQVRPDLQNTCNSFMMHPVEYMMSCPMNISNEWLHIYPERIAEGMRRVMILSPILLTPMPARLSMHSAFGGLAVFLESRN